MLNAKSLFGKFVEPSKLSPLTSYAYSTAAGETEAKEMCQENGSFLTKSTSFRKEGKRRLYPSKGISEYYQGAL